MLDFDNLPTTVDQLPAAAELDQVVRLAYAYSARGFDPEAAFDLFAQMVSQEEVTEMHAYKLQVSAREEYYNTRESCRWVHLVAAARHLATVYNTKPFAVFPEIAKRLQLAG